MKVAYIVDFQNIGCPFIGSEILDNSTISSTSKKILEKISNERPVFTIFFHRERSLGGRLDIRAKGIVLKIRD